MIFVFMLLNQPPAKCARFVFVCFSAAVQNIVAISTAGCDCFSLNYS